MNLYDLISHVREVSGEYHDGKITPSEYHEKLNNLYFARRSAESLANTFSFIAGTVVGAVVAILIAL